MKKTKEVDDILNEAGVEQSVLVRTKESFKFCVSFYMMESAGLSPGSDEEKIIRDKWARIIGDIINKAQVVVFRQDLDAFLKSARA